jgi:predicted O-methyltransferase YrrM
MRTAAAIAVLLALLLAFVALHWWRTLARLRNATLRGPFPIRSVDVAALDPAFAAGPLGPGLDAEVSYIGRASLDVPGGTSDSESWILAVLAKRARLMFEFGTCTGKTAYLWARNSPPDARVVTVTLHPDEIGSYAAAAGDVAGETRAAIDESRFARFLYNGTDVEGKVEQLFADTKALDTSPWKGQCDLVFVDASHAYSYVVSDSRKAIELARPGGLVLWHDYASPSHCEGVWRALNELAREIPLTHVARTTLVAYRKPLSSP